MDKQKKIIKGEADMKIKEEKIKEEERNREERNEEIKAQRKKEIQEREERDAKKAYHKRRSAQDRVEEEDLDKAREAIHHRQVGSIKAQVEKVLTQPEPKTGEKYSGYEKAYYLFTDRFRNDPILLKNFNRLIDENPKVALIIETLTEKDSKIHEDPNALLIAGKLLYINTPSDQKAVIDEILTAISQRVKALIPIKADELRQMHQLQRQSLSPEQARSMKLSEITHEIDSYISSEQAEKLKNWETHQEAIDEIMTTPGPQGEVTPVDETPLPGTLPEEALKNIDKEWEKVEQAQRAQKILSEREIDDVKKNILEAESKSFPKDVIPGSEEYLREVKAIYKHTESRLNELAEMARLKLRSEIPSIQEGINDPEEFLFRMSERAGIFGELLMRSPAMLKLFTGSTKESYRFRNQVFLRIHGSVLTQKRESSNENFSLYERVDFTSFVSLLRRGLSGIIVPETGKTVGQTWADWYTNLSTTIRLSRDIDFWASQPAASIDNFNKSLAMFQNEYSVQALTMPAVEQAYRAYESALMTIRDANDGYLPPSLIEYDSAHNTIYWDQWAQDLLLNKMVPQGVVRDSKRDFERMGGLPLVSPDGVTMEIGDKITEEDLLKDPEKLEIQMYMTLAKGFGMASMRFLEIVANSKIPGPVSEDIQVPGFHSPVYEGAAMALNYWNIFVKKWYVGGYKFFHMMNSVLPDGNRMPVDINGAMDAYHAHLDGTFEEKYGSGAKRMLDVLNFDRSSGAFSEFTPWRYFDDTLGWTDRQRQLMGGPTRVIFAAKFAEEKVKSDYLLKHYKNEFAEVKRGKGQPDSGPEFEALWRNEGRLIYGHKIDEEWKNMMHHDKEIQKLIENYRKAFIARVWIETALRSPQTVAHVIDIKMPIPGYEDSRHTKNRKLHSYVVEQVLGITPEDLEFGTVADEEGKYKINAAKYASPTEEQRKKLKEIFDLEGDMMSVREAAMSENREISEDDFNIIKDDVRQEHTKKYWNIVKQFIFGNTNTDHQQIFRDLGIDLHWDNYDIDWSKINNIDSTLLKYQNITTLPASYGTEIELTPKAFDHKFIDKEWEWIVSTDDTAFRQMDLLNLGSRQWVRRGGDAAAHLQGGMLLSEYIDKGLTPNPEIHKLAEDLMKIRAAYQADDIGVGYRVVGMLSYLTSKLYEFDYKKLKSPAQVLWGTRRNVAAWNANKRREFWDEIEHMDILPPHGHFETGWVQGPGIKDKKSMNIHELRKLNHADNVDVWTEIIALGLLLAIAITIWRAFTAPSEEESAGGGGGGHH